MSNIIPLGVAQGDIVESGSNANGSYVKYRNGVMDCWFKEGTARTSSIGPSSGVYYTPTINYVFPMPFASPPTVVPSAIRNSGSGLVWAEIETTLTATSCNIAGLSTSNAGSMFIGYYAIGTWSSVSAVNKPTYTIGRGIIESGPGYVKYEDGTMEQWGTKVIAGSTWTDTALAQPFSDTAYSYVGFLVGGGSGYCIGDDTQKTVSKIQLWHNAAGSCPVNWFARGRWQSATVANGSYTYGQGIVETGSNTNGEWIKFDNGTMICYKNDFAEMSTFTAYNYTFVSAEVQWDFPVPFVNTPSVSGGCRNIYNFGLTTNIYVSTPLYAKFTLSNGWGTTVRGNPITMAIGRWK